MLRSLDYQISLAKMEAWLLLYPTNFIKTVPLISAQWFGLRAAVVKFEWVSSSLLSVLVAKSLHVV